MPTHTISSALIKLFLAIPGAPWKYATWQDITGVRHGLFPVDNKDLPKDWTRDMATAIESYFDEYKQKKTEDDMIKFAASRKRVGEDTVAGRPLWRNWVTEQYPFWQIHGKISKILSDSRLHPLQIMVANNNLKTWPNSNSYLVTCLDQIGLMLFGDEAMDDTGHLLMALRDPTLILAQRTWLNLKKQTDRTQKSLVTLEAKAVAAFTALDRDSLTIAKIQSVIRAVGKWKQTAIECCTSEKMETINSMHAELEHLLEGLGAPVMKAGGIKSKGKTALCKVTTQALATLASEEDVSAIIHLYDEYFNADSNDSPEPRVGAPLRIDFRSPVEGADLGVEIECGMSSTELAENLGFFNGLPFMFNRRRHIGGLTPWDPTFPTDQKDPALEKTRLHWHQLCGIHATIRKIFSEEPSASHLTGILKADEVGLGKTFQAMAVVAFLADLAMRQHRGSVPLPPIIVKQPYLSDYSKLPLRPHLILVPGTLSNQWETELKIMLRPKSFDILLYGTGRAQHENFWSADGPYHSSKHQEFNRVIIASQSALQQDFALLYRGKPGGPLPWDHPNPLPGHAARIPNTLYGQKYLSIVYDEAQGARNAGPKHSAALLILEQTIVRVILTATPLQTSTKDLASMGRLTGIPHFSSEAAYAEQQSDTATLRRAKQERDQEFEPKDDNEGDEDDPVNLCQVEISRRMQSRFDGRVIRRTALSRDPSGQPLINLPPLIVVYGVLDLTERETAIIDSVTESETIDQASASNGRNIISSNFYYEHRTGVTFARENPDEKIPTFKSLQEWELVKSTKIDTCARMCKHILSRDDAPPITFEDGKAVFPPIPTSGVFTQRTKIIIYQEFPSFGPLARNALLLYGVKAASIDGRTSYERRAAIVQKFRTDPNCRVLLFSKVGTVGLNLSNARVVIFLDQPWSAQEETQIDGRAYRQPQMETVISYHLLASNTADIVLSSMARGKRHMLEAFLTTDTAKNIKKILAGDVIFQENDDEGDDDAPIGDDGVPSKKPKARPSTKGKKGKGGKGKSKASRQTREIIDDAMDVDDAPHMPANDEEAGPAIDGGHSTDPGSYFEGDISIPGPSSGYGTDLSMHTAPRTDDELEPPSRPPSSPLLDLLDPPSRPPSSPPIDFPSTPDFEHRSLHDDDSHVPSDYAAPRIPEVLATPDAPKKRQRTPTPPRDVAEPSTASQSNTNAAQNATTSTPAPPSNDTSKARKRASEPKRRKKSEPAVVRPPTSQVGRPGIHAPDATSAAPSPAPAQHEPSPISTQLAPNTWPALPSARLGVASGVVSGVARIMPAQHRQTKSVPHANEPSPAARKEPAEATTTAASGSTSTSSLTVGPAGAVARPRFQPTIPTARQPAAFAPATVFTGLPPPTAPARANPFARKSQTNRR